MTQSVTFERWESPQPYVFTFWPDGELHIFRDEAAARRWAAHQGLRPVFSETKVEESEPGRVAYQFLGVTGEEEA